MKQTLELLKQHGARLTKTRLAVLEIFFRHSQPFSVAEILVSLKKQGIVVNKTTVYREMEFLLEKGIVTAVFIDEKHTKYELNLGHHHHLVCRNCGNIEEVEMKEIEDLFDVVEKKLKQKMKFTNISHSLEFFGICKKCS
jgi:Fe2+ or Zn2+ uptake regulation protein